MNDYQFFEFSYINMSREFMQTVAIDDERRYIVYLDEYTHGITIKTQIRVKKRRIFGQEYAEDNQYNWKDVGIDGSISIDVNHVPAVVKAIQKIVKYVPLK